MKQFLSNQENRYRYSILSNTYKDFSPQDFWEINAMYGCDAINKSLYYPCYGKYLTQKHKLVTKLLALRLCCLDWPSMARIAIALSTVYVAR